MKTIFAIFINDLKGLKKNLIMFAVAIGIAILPALYAWFNIAASWDPYGNTANVPFAVTSLDEGTEIMGLSINAGDSILENLKANTDIGWEFVDLDTALDRTKSGEYYAAVVIPKDFSANLLSLTTGEFKQATLDYYVNEKVNAIAPKITDKGAEAIQGAVDSAFVSKLTESMAQTLNSTDKTLGEDQQAIIDKIKEGLNKTKDDIANLIDSAELLGTTLDSVDQLLESTRKMIPTVKKTINKAGDTVTDVKGALNSVKDSSKQLVPTIRQALNTSDIRDLSDRLDTIFSGAGDDATAVSAGLKTMGSKLQRIITANTNVISILQKIEGAIGIKTTKIVSRLEDANAKAQKMIDRIDAIAEKIDASGKVPAQAKDELNGLISELETQLDGAGSEFGSIQNDIEEKLEGNFSSLDSVADFAKTLSDGTGQLDKAISNAQTMDGNLKKVITDLIDFLKSSDKKIDDMLGKLDNPDKLSSLEELIRPIIEKPMELGTFISNPVDGVRHAIYPVENYGSAMTPFYTSLAIWVGGIVLVAVVNVTLEGEDKKRFRDAGPVKQFFGRYMTYFLIGEIQTLIIALGDIFFLKAQMDNPYLFVLSCIISSLVYTLFIYSLTITFSVVGKALAVIILVLQVAGSGGTFPIELLPGAFRALSTYLPFRYGVPAMRETVAGVDVGTFWKNIGILALFIIPSLLIGLLLRKPCMRIIAFFNKKIEESDLIV